MAPFQERQIPFDYDRFKKGEPAHARLFSYMFDREENDEIIYTATDKLSGHKYSCSWYGVQGIAEGMREVGAYHLVVEEVGYCREKSIQQLLDEALARVL